MGLLDKLNKWYIGRQRKALHSSDDKMFREDLNDVLADINKPRKPGFLQRLRKRHPIAFKALVISVLIATFGLAYGLVNYATPLQIDTPDNGGVDEPDVPDNNGPAKVPKDNEPDIPDNSPQVPEGCPFINESLEDILNYIEKRDSEVNPDPDEFIVPHADKLTHLDKINGTTSEAAALLFQATVDYAKATGNYTPALQVLEYIRAHMMPLDGYKDPHLKFEGQDAEESELALMNWYIDTDNDELRRMYGTHGKSPAIQDSKNAEFSVAPDADQNLIEGLVELYELTGDEKYLEFAKRIGNDLEKIVIAKDGPYPGTTMFSGGMGTSDGWAWHANFDANAYTGYQDPAAWQSIGKEDLAKAQIEFLKAAQDEYEQQYGERGLFMPIYNKENGWTWDGPDGNTHWMGFQLRAIESAAKYYEMTGDETAKQVVEDFVDYMLENSDIDDKEIEMPAELEKYTGNTIVRAPDPDAQALFARTMLIYGNATGDEALMKTARIMTRDLEQKIIENNGKVPSGGVTYAFHQAEVMRTMLSDPDVMTFLQYHYIYKK